MKRGVPFGIAVVCIVLSACTTSGNVSQTSQAGSGDMIAMSDIENGNLSEGAMLLDQSAEPEKYVQKSILADLFGGGSSSIAGDPEAQAELGLLYQEGQGVDRDPSKAVDLYTRAAFSGDPAAQAELGIIYEKGLGVTKDPVTAYAWFLLASDQRNDDGKIGAQRLSQILTSDQISAATKLHDQFKAAIH